MIRRRSNAIRVAVLLLAGLGLVFGAQAQAADIRILSAGAFRPVLDAVVPPFESRSGNRVFITTDTAGGVASRIARGEPFDIAVLTQAAAQKPQTDGQVILLTPIASVGIGLAVKSGAAKPDISTVASFRSTMLAARSVAMVNPASGGTSGIYLAGLFDKLGIAEQMKPKLVLTDGGLSAEKIISGQAEMALGQSSELLAVSGTTLVGALPAELQTRTTYLAGLNPKAAEAPLVLLAVLAAPETQAILKQKGMGPP